MLWKAYYLSAVSTSEMHLVQQRRAFSAQRCGTLLGGTRHSGQPLAPDYLIPSPLPEFDGAPDREKVGVGIVFHAPPTGGGEGGFKQTAEIYFIKRTLSKGTDIDGAQADIQMTCLGHQRLCKHDLIQQSIS
jgi:hypothetical protein